MQDSGTVLSMAQLVLVMVVALLVFGPRYRSR
jgi:Sec-independent protein translocase protein TatA